MYEKAGVGPEDVDVVELHDCFTANELLTYEAIGLCKEGEAEKFIEAGDNTYGMQARSVWTDERGDQVFSELRGGAGGPGHPIEGRFVGGTGRYAGVSGQAPCRYRPRRQQRGRGVLCR